MTLSYGPSIGAIWILWFFYWYASAFNMKAVRRRESLGSRFAHVLPLVAGVVVLFIPDNAITRWVGAGGFTARVLPRGPATSWIGIFLLVTGLAFSVWARLRLGGNWSGTVTLKQDHELVRAGPYRWVRHPIYSGILLGFIGTAVAMGEWRGLIAVGLVIFAFRRKIRLEELWMIETFGDAYRRYRAEVSALIPYIL